MSLRKGVVAGEIIRQNAAQADVLGTVAVGAAEADQAVLLGIFLRPFIAAVVAGVAVADLHAVQIPGDGGGAGVAVGT